MADEPRDVLSMIMAGFAVVGALLLFRKVAPHLEGILEEIRPQGLNETGEIRATGAETAPHDIAGEGFNTHGELRDQPRHKRRRIRQTSTPGFSRYGEIE